MIVLSLIVKKKKDTGKKIDKEMMLRFKTYKNKSKNMKKKC